MTRFPSQYSDSTGYCSIFFSTLYSNSVSVFYTISKTTHRYHHQALSDPVTHWFLLSYHCRMILLNSTVWSLTFMAFLNFDRWWFCLSLGPGFFHSGIYCCHFECGFTGPAAKEISISKMTRSPWRFHSLAWPDCGSGKAGEAAVVIFVFFLQYLPLLRTETSQNALCWWEYRAFLQ
jgi:hypothetical protein